jgi:outer membrane protein OmpA-like peptidoglycan-associated protein
MLFVATAFMANALAKDRNCDFYKWPNKHCPKPDNLVMLGINFNSGSSQILKSSYDTLDKNIALLQTQPSLKFTIIGHTDSQGTETANQSLSMKRAQAVMDYFKSHGIDPARMGIDGKGESQPVANDDTSDGRYKNRRIEIEFN